MKRFVSHNPWRIMLMFALCSIGAKSPKCTPSGSQPSQDAQLNQDSVKPFCYTDPPAKCVAFCIAVDQIAFTPMCEGPDADELTILFMEEAINGAEDLEAQGIQVCPAPDSKHWVTPCDVGIIPQEWPNQDHAVCQPAPPGCAY
ncbi:MULTISPECIES: hypothetical protein [Sorangium]|uniref:Uncharacterized protein n=1 Tax=Sorangium cellulosum TaxID=56 RepID=A0A4P2QR07_SORCE|nr:MULTISPECIES: hypothetical protein [Sorangium]AUX32331.1 uncharacterized protein SOCE836_044680 [Sorangium cellulosum]WCQ91705.1 hypothetical protein NQZ70_04428 [Sorangium sp. Soce836]